MRWGFTIGVAAALGGCEGPPAALCDDERFSWALEDVAVTPSMDVSDEPGIQIDLRVRSSLAAGLSMRVSIAEGLTDDDEFVPGPSTLVGSEGLIEFPALTVPMGTIRLRVEGRNVCRDVRTTRRLFVNDGGGQPSCSLGFVQETTTFPGASSPFLGGAEDTDPDTPGFQGAVRVETGRSDVTTTLLLLRLSPREESVFEAPQAASGVAEFSVSLEDGEYAANAICRWAAVDVPRRSATHNVTVDTTAPDCVLVNPSEAVVDADDTDGDLSNGIQFPLIGSSSSPDVIGTVPVFTVGGTVILGTPVSVDGESTATGTLPSPPPIDQQVAMELADWAGNLCRVGLSP